MYKFLSKYGQLSAFLLGALITVIFLVSVFSGAEEFSALTEEDQMKTNMFNLGLYSAIVLIVVCAIIALLFGIVYMITHFKQSLKTVISIVILIAIFVIGYMIADPDGSGQLAQTILEFNVRDMPSKLISAGLTTTFVLGILAIASVALFEVYNLVK